MRDRASEGLLVYPGLPDHLVGGDWPRRQKALARATGRAQAHCETHYLEVGGAGNGAPGDGPIGFFSIGRINRNRYV